MEAVAKIATDTDKSRLFPNGKPGIRWYKEFLKRHPEISQREAEGINKARALITEESIRSWFRTLRKYLEDNNFQDVLHDPNRIFNGDESGFSLCPKTGKVLGPKGWKNLYVIKSGKGKENITVLITFNASGAICPPLVVYPYVRPPKALTENVPMNWVIGKSDSGWMTGEVFFEYISNDFNSWLTRTEIKRPILLLIDGHKSHMTLPLSEFCAQHDIILYALPPNTTHILQPADVSVFKPMKQQWKNTVKEWQKRPENSNQIITKMNFCKVFEETLQATQMQSHIIKGFRKCGLYPFNPESVDYTKCVKNFLEKNCQKQTVSANALEQTLTLNDFDVARRVIESISCDLKLYGINVDVVITEIDFQKALILEKNSNKDKPSTSTTISTDQGENIMVGSIVPMDDLTLVPVDVIESEEGMIFNVGKNWDENYEREQFNEFENLSLNNNTGNESITILSKCEKEEQNKIGKIDTNESDNAITNKGETENDKAIEMEIENDDERNETIKANDKENEKEEKTETENGKQIETEIENDQRNGTINANDKDNEKEEKTETENGKQIEMEIENDQRNGRVNENDKENVREENTKTENGKEIETEIENDKRNGTEIENDKENKQANQQEKAKDSETEKETYQKKTDSKKTVKLPNKIHDSTIIISDSTDKQAQNKGKNEDIIMDENEGASGSCNKEKFSDPFEKHLTFPETALKKTTGNRVKEKLPSAISSAAWRTYYSRKDDEKREKMEKAILKRKNKEEKRDKKQVRPTKKSKKKAVTSIKDNTKIQSLTRKDKILCTLCEEELCSDAEEDENKNIGCDTCPRWYHLKCTLMSDLTYSEAAQKDYICDMCC